MAGHIRCARCRRPLSDDDVKSPEVLYSEHGIMCAECAANYRAALAGAEEEIPQDAQAAPEGAATVSEPAPETEEPAESRSEEQPAQAVEGPSAPAAEPAEEAPVEPAPDETETVEVTPPPAPDVHEMLELLENIRREVSLIRRSILFEKSSVWNVLGAVVQCFAIAAFVVACARWSQDPVPLLLVAVLLQVMTLTFYFHGK